MLEERAGNVARCGERKDVCSLGIGANDVGPCCCVVTHRGDLLQRVVGPAHDEITHASNAVGAAGNVVGVVLDFPTNVTCRVPAQRGLEGSHVGSVERLAHGRGVGRHVWACVSRWRARNSWLTCTVHTSMKQIHGYCCHRGS